MARASAHAQESLTLTLTPDMKQQLQALSQRAGSTPQQWATDILQAVLCEKWMVAQCVAARPHAAVAEQCEQLDFKKIRARHAHDEATHALIPTVPVSPKTRSR